MIKFLLVVILQIAITINAFGQKNIVYSKAKTANSFIDAIWKEKRNTKYVMQNLMYFEPNDTISINKRTRMLKAHLKHFKKEKGPLIDLSDYQLIPYNEYSGEDKVTFLNETENIKVLWSKGNVVTYLYFKESKIRSFDYITKGMNGYAYFILY